MKVQTLSIVVGSEACNAACPFCVSKMTPPVGITLAAPEPRWDRLEKALLFAERMGIVTVLLTGKGEPTLFPKLVSAYLEKIGKRFPFVELQTNGLDLSREKENFLYIWKSKGLTTVAISVVSYDPEINQKVYYSHRPNMTYQDLPELIRRVHAARLSVRLSTIMIKGGIDSPDEVMKMIKFAKTHEVDQLTLTPVNRPTAFENEEVFNWVGKNGIDAQARSDIHYSIKRSGTLLLELQHGAQVYDVSGQNVCLNNCLTLPKGEEIRQVIFFPDGHLRYDWQYPGAILM